jgi:hypothetical protein
MSLPGRWRWCDRPWLCDARKEQNALHTLIHQRRLTPSCGGLAPTAERTMDPARIFTESLTPRPELENSQGQNRPFGDVGSMSGLPESGLIPPLHVDNQAAVLPPPESRIWNSQHAFDQAREALASIRGIGEPAITSDQNYFGRPKLLLSTKAASPGVAAR